MYQLLNCATKNKFVITYDETHIIHVTTWDTAGKEAAHVLPAIMEGCDAAQITPEELKGLLVVHGPGSFTGLRVGVTVANMLAMVHPQVPLFAVTAGQLLAHVDGYAAPRYVFAPYVSDVFLFDTEGNFVERLPGKEWVAQEGDAGETVDAVNAQIRQIDMSLMDHATLLSLHEHLTPVEGQLLPFYAKDANITTPKRLEPGVLPA